MMAGGNPLELVILSEWFIVLGVTWFALFATYGSDFLRFFFRDAFLALFSKRQPNERYVEIAQSGSRYALGAAVIAFLLGFVITLGRVDGPIKEVGEHIASATIGIVLGVMLSELYFPFIVSCFRSSSVGSPEEPSRLWPVIALWASTLAGLFLVLWVVVMNTTVNDRSGEKYIEPPPVEFLVRTADKPDRSSRPKLTEIELPADPSDVQIREYIRQILRTAEGRSSWSSSDPQAGMLMKVGSQNLRLLIDAMGTDRHGGADVYLVNAAVELADEGNKALILKSLPIYQELVKAVIKQGWEKDARETLLRELAAVRGYLPTEWVQAVANLQDSSTYPLLKNHFVNGHNRGFTYESICDLPGIDLEKDIPLAWNRAKKLGKDESYEINGMSKIAAGHGIQEALTYLIDSLNKPERDTWMHDEARKTVIRLTDQSGSDAEIIQWYCQNKGKLVFDTVEKKYKVKQ